MGRGVRRSGRRHGTARPAAAPCRRGAHRRLQLPAASARRPARATAPPEPDNHHRCTATPSRPAAQGGAARRVNSDPHTIPLRHGERHMPRGRQPQGEHALSDAERQARYRARQLAKQAPPVLRYRRPADRRSRAQRWRDAVAELQALQTEYAAWSDALPDSLRDSATAEALQAIVELDLNDLAAIVPPRGYGRD